MIIKIYEPDQFEMAELGKLFLDMKVRYLKGTEAEYLTEGSIIGNQDGTVTLLPSRSKTDLLQYQIGLSVKFDSDNL